MLTVHFDPFPVISTERLLLRQVREEDADEIFFLRSDKRVLQYLDRLAARSVEEAGAFIRMINEQQKNNESILWGINLKADTRLIGTLGFWNITKQHYRAEIGYVMHPDFYGKGIMSEALAAVLDYGFNTMKLHSVEANVNPENTPSIKLLERNKFNREGYFRENYFFNGKFSDSAIYSLLNKILNCPMKIQSEVRNISASATILKAGLTAGTLDILSACTYYYIKSGKNPLNILPYVASGVFGKSAFAGGAGMIAAGLLFHYLIAFLWTLIFFFVYPYISSFLKSPIFTGLIYGVLIWLVMNLLIVPLSRTPKSPFKMLNAIINMMILMLAIGLPIALIIAGYYKRKLIVSLT